MHERREGEKGGREGRERREGEKEGEKGSFG